jgi:predicted nucleic acid-binding protein
MVLCDTNVLINYFNGNTNTISNLEEIGFDNIVLSSITVMELLQGMTTKVELLQMKKLLSYYDVLHFNQEVSVKAIDLIEAFKLSHNLQIPDAIIGASAIVYGLQLFTYNLKDFRFMPELKLLES